MTEIISKPKDKANPFERTENAKGINQEHGFGYFETIGRRSEQEDALAWHVLSESDLTSKDAKEQLTPTEIGHRLWTTYQTLDTPDLNAGTTASTTIYDGKGNFITATLADAASFAVVYNKTGDALGVIRLNSVTHKPSDPDEKIRIEAKGGFVAELFGVARVDGQLAVSRAIGDGKLKEHGVSSEASIDVTNVGKIAKDLSINPETIGSIQIINTCDGFTDGAGTKKQNKTDHEQYLLNILKSIESPGVLPQNELAEILALRAISDGSGDNVSVAVQTITSKTPPVFLGIYDGHGGKAASCRVADNIGRVFKEQCALTAEQYAKQELSVTTKATVYQRDNKDMDLPSDQLHHKLELPKPDQKVETIISEEATPKEEHLAEPSKDYEEMTNTKDAVTEPKIPPTSPVKKVAPVDEKQLLATVNDLLKLTKEYHSSLNDKKTAVDQIKPITQNLIQILESSKSNEDKIKGYYTYLDKAHQIKGESAGKNIDIIKKDTSKSAANFLMGIAIIAATIATGILPGLLVMGIVYAATGRHALDLFKSEGERFEKETKLIKEKTGFVSSFFKPASPEQPNTDDMQPDNEIKPNKS